MIGKKDISLVALLAQMIILMKMKKKITAIITTTKPITKINNMEILIYLAIAVVMGVISYYIWDAKDGRTIKRGDEWDQ